MTFEKHQQLGRPLARSAELVVEPIGMEAVIFDTASGTTHALKPLAAATFLYADGERTAAEIAELASYRLEMSVSEADVNDAISQLEALELIDVPGVHADAGISRRTALRMFGAAGVGAALITSVSASTALAHCSGINPSQISLGDYFGCSANGNQSTVNYTYKSKWASGSLTGQYLQPDGTIVVGATSSNGDGPTGSKPSNAQAWDIYPQPGVSTINTDKGNFTGPNSGSGWSGNYPSGIVPGNTCSYLRYNGSSYVQTSGEWQCVPCDGTDNFTCCSVVCAPAGLGYDWGATPGGDDANHDVVTPVDNSLPAKPIIAGGCTCPYSNNAYGGFGYYGKFCTNCNPTS